MTQLMIGRRDSKMNFKEIEIGDKNLINGYLRKFNPKASEMNFTNLFIWRMFYNFRFTVVADLLCIVSMAANKEPYALMPVGEINEHNFREAVTCLKEYFNNQLGKPMVFRMVEEDALKFFKQLPGFEKKIIYDRNESDYLYLASDLINLKGKKFHGKRNHISRFKREHEYEYVKLTSELLDECDRIMNEWCSRRNCECRRDVYCERHANMELLNNFEKLDCKGALIKVDGRFEAYTVGEELNSNTAVIHMEKANSTINGLYAFINQQFCEREWSHMKYINREEDLGIEGLRKAKLSYNPVCLVNKYTVIIE